MAVAVLHTNGPSFRLQCGGSSVRTALPVLESGETAPFVYLTVCRESTSVKLQATAEILLGDAAVDLPDHGETDGVGRVLVGLFVTVDDSPVVLATNGATHIAHRRAAIPGETVYLGISPLTTWPHDHI